MPQCAARFGLPPRLHIRPTAAHPHGWGVCAPGAACIRHHPPRQQQPDQYGGCISTCSAGGRRTGGCLRRDRRRWKQEWQRQRGGGAGGDGGVCGASPCALVVHFMGVAFGQLHCSKDVVAGCVCLVFRQVCAPAPSPRPVPLLSEPAPLQPVPRFTCLLLHIPTGAGC